MDALPSTVEDRKLAERTAIWGLKNGIGNPIEIPERTEKPKPKAADRVRPVDPTKPASEQAEKPAELILSPGAPLISARRFVFDHHTLDGTRTLLHQNSTFFSWKRSHYVEMTWEEMRAGLYRFLDRAKRVTEDGEIVPFDPTRAKVANVLEAAAAETQLSHLVRPPTWLGDGKYPAPAEIIACNNILLHLPTGDTHPHTPRFYTVNALPFDYLPKASKPVAWLRFLDSVWPGDQQAIDTLQKIFGLALTGETKYQKLVLIVGPKRSGKGTIARVLTQLLGADNVCGPTLSGLSTNFGLAPLIGKRVAIISDARLSGKADQQVIVERLLSITGEDGIQVDRKFRDGWNGKLDVRFIILTNELPRLTDSSGALAGRFIILRMTETYYGKEDLGLGVKLTPELPGILLWAIAGWKRLEARGHFVPPQACAKAAASRRWLLSTFPTAMDRVPIVPFMATFTTNHMTGTTPMVLAFASVFDAEMAQFATLLFAPITAPGLNADGSPQTVQAAFEAIVRGDLSEDQDGSAAWGPSVTFDPGRPVLISFKVRRRISSTLTVEPGQAIRVSAGEARALIAAGEAFLVDGQPRLNDKMVGADGIDPGCPILPRKKEAAE